MVHVEETYKLPLRNSLHMLFIVDECPLGSQIPAIHELSRNHPHTIEIVEEERMSDGEHSPLTCHAFALDLLAIERLTTPDGDEIKPSAPFIAELIDLKLLVEIDGPEEDCLLVYFDDYFDEATITHSGRWRSGRVISKWGRGHIWSHDMFETPASWGCLVRFYRSLPPEESHRLWADHAQKFHKAR